MLKEYTLKMTVRVGGDTHDECDEKLDRLMEEGPLDCTFSITHEEVVEVDPWTSQIELDKFPPVEPEQKD